MPFALAIAPPLAVLLGPVPPLTAPIAPLTLPEPSTPGVFVPSAPLEVPASAFADVLSYRTKTASTFADVPLNSLDTTTRSRVLTDYARRIDAELHPSATFEDAPGPEYSYTRNGRRVLCKTCQLKWNRGVKCWQVQWRGVKLPVDGVRDEPLFDELVLALYSPAGVHLFRHDLLSGVSTQGKSTAAMGHQVSFYGPVQQNDWRVALQAILQKLKASGAYGQRALLAAASFDDPWLTVATAARGTRTARAFAGVPLAECSPKARGELLQAPAARACDVSAPAPAP